MSHEHFHNELPRPNKGGMGRKKIEIKRIDEAKNRQVTFNKRKVGLIKKAIELSILCDCDMIMYVIHNGRVYQYRSTNPEDVLRLVAKNDAYESFTNSDLVNGHLRRHKKKRISMSSQSSHSTTSQDVQQSPMFMPTPVNMAMAAANAANGHISMNHMDIHGHRGSTTSLSSPAMMNGISITKSPMQRSYQQQSPNFHGLTNLQLPSTQGYVTMNATTSPNGTLSPSSSSSTVSTSSSSSTQHMNPMNSPMYPSYQQSSNYVPSSSPTFSPTPNTQQRRYSNPNIMMPPYDLTAPHFATYPNVQQPTPRHASNTLVTSTTRTNTTNSYPPLASPQNNGYMAPNPTKRRRTSSTSTPQHGPLSYPTTMIPGMDIMNSHDISLSRRTSLMENPPAFESLDTLSSIATTTSRTSPTPLYTQHMNNMKKRGREEDMIKTEEEMNHHLDL